MNFVILDLEWDNSYFSNNGTALNEIIEFGAVKTDEDLNIIDEFSVLVKPKISKFVSKRTKKLTHLTSKILKSEGVPYPQALESFKNFLGDGVLLTWSTSDIIALMDNHKFYFGTGRLDYLNGYINAQTYCEKMMGCYDPAKQMGLSAAAEKLGIQTDNIELHRALDDSKLTLSCLKKVYDNEKIPEFIQDASQDEFYKKLLFKPSYITDINNPLVDKSKMKFNCPSCGKRAVRKTAWQSKGRYFRATYKCNNCNYGFYGKIQYKIKYDGVDVKMSTVPINEDKAKDKDVKNGTE